MSDLSKIRVVEIRPCVMIILCFCCCCVRSVILIRYSPRQIACIMRQSHARTSSDRICYSFENGVLFRGAAVRIRWAIYSNEYSRTVMHLSSIIRVHGRSRVHGAPSEKLYSISDGTRPDGRCDFLMAPFVLLFVRV